MNRVIRVSLTAICVGLAMILCSCTNFEGDSQTVAPNDRDVLIAPGSMNDISVQGFHGYEVSGYDIQEIDNGCKVEIYVTKDPAENLTSTQLSLD